MEHMYVHSVVVRMCWVAGCHIWKCKLCIQDLELSYMQQSCCSDFTVAKILPNPKLEKERKIFIRGLNKQYGFASQEFLVVRGNG